MVISSCILALILAPTALAFAVPTPQSETPPETTISAASQAATQPAPPPGPAAIVLASPDVVDGAVPTISPAWGAQVVWAGADIVVTGAERISQRGIEGQIMTVSPNSAGAWAANAEYASLRNLNPGAAALQHVAAEGEWFVSNVEQFDQTGEVQLLRRDASSAGWSFFARLVSPAGQPDSLFGSALDLRGGTLVIGTTDNAVRNRPRKLVPSPRVHIFSVKDGTWSGEGFLAPPASAPNAPWFGVSVAAAGDRVFVSCPQTYTPSPKQPLDLGGQPSCVYIYRRGLDPSKPTVWMLESTITQPLGMSDNAFGITIATDGDVLVIRSLNVQAGDVNAQRVGEPSLLVYRKAVGPQGTTWKYESVLRPSDGITAGLGIGYAMSVDGGLVAVGDASAVNGNERTGAVYVFGHDGTSWAERYRLLQSVPCAPGRFGAGVCIRNGIVAVGRVRNEREGIEPGGVYIYRLP